MHPEDDISRCWSADRWRLGRWCGGRSYLRLGGGILRSRVARYVEFLVSPCREARAIVRGLGLARRGRSNQRGGLAQACPALARAMCRVWEAVSARASWLTRSTWSGPPKRPHPLGPLERWGGEGALLGKVFGTAAVGRGGVLPSTRQPHALCASLGFAAAFSTCHLHVRVRKAGAFHLWARLSAWRTIRLGAPWQCHRNYQLCWVL